MRFGLQLVQRPRTPARSACAQALSSARFWLARGHQQRRRRGDRQAAHHQPAPRPEEAVPPRRRTPTAEGGPGHGRQHPRADHDGLSPAGAGLRRLLLRKGHARTSDLRSMVNAERPAQRHRLVKPNDEAFTALTADRARCTRAVGTRGAHSRHDFRTLRVKSAWGFLGRLWLADGRFFRPPIMMPQEVTWR